MHSPTISRTPLAGIEVTGEYLEGFESILTPEALAFLSEMHRRFNHRRKDLLHRRTRRQKEIDRGRFPDFLPETLAIREGDWTVAPLPEDLMDRRVEITGPVDRKMIINALNSGAKVFMADFEDSNAPSWANCVNGQINLRDAINRTITFKDEARGKSYQLNAQTATLMVRPRGWHLEEKHMLVDGKAISGSLFDFGLFFYHNATNLLAKGSGPYFYLPKLESHLEARLWNDVFIWAQSKLGLPLGTIKATVLVETILASFELHEILYELRDHSAGLNCGRWDYIFSYIKRFRGQSDFLVPDRAQVTMQAPFMKAYSDLVIQVCHKRNVHAMGGMAAQIPIKNDPDANAIAMEKVRIDKEREARNGHDGTWVAHPGLVQTAMDEFDTYMPGPNQIGNKREDVSVSAADLIEIPSGTITEAGLRLNIDVGIRYMESWLRGQGCVPIYNLMEDAATAEISRSQVWQWLNHEDAVLDDGRPVNRELYRQVFQEQVQSIRNEIGEQNWQDSQFEAAAELFDKLITKPEFEEFLTLTAYNHLS